MQTNRFHPVVQNRVAIMTPVIADYQINYIMAECRKRNIPIIYHSFDKFTLSRNTVDSRTNGWSTRRLTIREKDIFEFIMLFDQYICQITVKSNDDYVITRYHDHFHVPNDHPEIAPFRDGFHKRWGYSKSILFEVRIPITLTQ